MNNNSILEELMDKMLDEQAYINVLSEYCLRCNDGDLNYIFRLLSQLNEIHNKLLTRIDEELFLSSSEQ